MRRVIGDARLVTTARLHSRSAGRGGDSAGDCPPPFGVKEDVSATDSTTSGWRSLTCRPRLGRRGICRRRGSTLPCGRFSQNFSMTGGRRITIALAGRTYALSRQLVTAEPRVN